MADRPPASGRRYGSKHPLPTEAQLSSVRRDQAPYQRQQINYPHDNTEPMYDVPPEDLRHDKNEVGPGVSYEVPSHNVSLYGDSPLEQSVCEVPPSDSSQNDDQQSEYHCEDPLPPSIPPSEIQFYTPVESEVIISTPPHRMHSSIFDDNIPQVPSSDGLSKPLRRTLSKVNIPLEVSSDFPSKPLRRTHSKVNIPPEISSDVPSRPLPHGRFEIDEDFLPEFSSDGPSKPQSRSRFEFEDEFLPEFSSNAPSKPQSRSSFEIDDKFLPKFSSNAPSKPQSRNRFEIDDEFLPDLSSHGPSKPQSHGRFEIDDFRPEASSDVPSRPLFHSPPERRSIDLDGNIQSESSSDAPPRPLPRIPSGEFSDILDDKDIQPEVQSTPSNSLSSTTYQEINERKIRSTLASSAETKPIIFENRPLPPPPSSASGLISAPPVFQQFQTTSSSSIHIPDPPPTLKSNVLSNASLAAKPRSRSDISNAPSLHGGQVPASPESHPLRSMRTCDCNNPQLQRFVEAYVRYSIAHRIYLIMSGQYHSEEIQKKVQSTYHKQLYGNKIEKLQFIGMCLFGIGVLLVFFYLIQPAAMLLLGAFGYYNCTTRGGLVVYLLFGGSITLAMTCLRSFASMLTELKSRNCLHAHNSTLLTGMIFTMELMIIPLFVISLIIIVVTTVTLLEGGRKIVCSDTITENCCPLYVFIITAILNVLQFTLYLLTVPYVCSVLVITYMASKVKGLTRDIY